MGSLPWALAPSYPSPFLSSSPSRSPPPFPPYPLPAGRLLSFPLRVFFGVSLPLTHSSRLPETCRASQTAGLFPSLTPHILVRDARVEDCWEVADTHCRSFFPEYTFPMDLVLRIDRYIALLSGFSVPPGCMRACLVAVIGNSLSTDLCVTCDDLVVGGYVAGILTVDTVADFLPRKGPLRQRRTGIAYISNVAVREGDRRKGIAKMLVAEAEARARSWGCRSVALHCDADNLPAMQLYRARAFKCVNVPKDARWPQPTRSAGVKSYSFMMKLLIDGNH